MLNLVKLSFFETPNSNNGNDNNVNNDYWQGPGGEEDEAGWTGQH